jgi:hypothetical protein
MNNPSVSVDPSGLYGEAPAPPIVAAKAGDSSGSNSNSSGGGSNLTDLLKGPRTCGAIFVGLWSRDLGAWSGTRQIYRDAEGKRDEGKENAFRHCIWQCLLEYYCPYDAEIWGYGREWLTILDDGWIKPDTEADFHNNSFGRYFGFLARMWGDPLRCYRYCHGAVHMGLLDDTSHE